MAPQWLIHGFEMRYGVPLIPAISRLKSLADFGAEAQEGQPRVIRIEVMYGTPCWVGSNRGAHGLRVLMTLSFLSALRPWSNEGVLQDVSDLARDFCQDS